MDTPQGTWAPQNYDKTTHGDVPLHEALAKSYNLATINLGLALGFQAVTDVISKLGIQRPVPQVPAMFIGAMPMTPLEVTQMYQTLAAGGFYSPLRALREVQAADGTSLQRYPLDVRQSVPEGPVYLLNRNLQEVVSNGTGRSLTNYLVWLGRDDNQPAGLTGASGALQVWGDMLRRSGVAALEFTQPDTVELEWVDSVTSELTGAGCEQAIQFPFIIGSAPTNKSTCIDNPVRRMFRKIFR
jgi:penicillin-binding protein 1B